MNIEYISTDGYFDDVNNIKRNENVEMAWKPKNVKKWKFRIRSAKKTNDKGKKKIASATNSQPRS